MEIKIGVIDDDVVFLKQVEEVIFNQFSYHKGLFCKIDTFTSCKDIMEHLDKYQCLFLDVEMPGESGLEFAEYVRINYSHITIIFISSFVNYVFRSFSVRPFTYILKSELEEQGLKEIKRFISYYLECNRVYFIKIDNVLYELRQKEIKWIAKQGNSLIFNYQNKQYKVRSNIKTVLKELANYFVLINKSEIINLHFISSITKDKILLKDETIHYISRRKNKSILNAYYNFLKTEIV